MSISKATLCRVPTCFGCLGAFFILAGGAFAEPAAEPFTVSGRVLPLAGAIAPPSSLVVELRPAFPSFEAQRTALHGDEADALSTARVRADGTFLLIVPKPDAYRIDARARGFRTFTIPFVPLVEPIELAAVEPVTVLPLAVQVLDPSGQPAGGVSVRVASAAAPEAPADPNAWRPAMERTRTDSQGRAVVYRDAEAKIQILAETTGAAGLAEVEAGATWTTVKLTVRPTLALAVRDSAGRPAFGALVYAAGRALAKTDEGGRAEISAQLALDTGSAPLLVLAENGEWAEVTAPKGGGKSPTAIRLGPPRKARGRVLESNTDQFLPKSLVWTRSDGVVGWVVQSDANGRFEILVAGSGEPTLGAAATGHAWREIPAAVARPGDAPITLRLDRAADLKNAVGVTGTVVDGAGKPIAGAELFAIRKVETSTRGHRTQERIEQRLGASDNQGGFHAEGVLPGAFDLVARRNGYVPGRVGDLQIPEGGRLPDVKIVLSRGVRIEGRLRDSNGHPAAGVTIEANKVFPAGTPISQIEPFESISVSDRDGLFTLTGLEPGRYQVKAESPLGQATGLVEVSKKGGRIDLQLEPAAVLP